MSNNRFNNPYVQRLNQTITDGLVSEATSGINNILRNVQGVEGAIGSVTGQLASLMGQAGMSGSGLQNIVSGNMDKFISGSSTFFEQSAPTRMTSSAFANRNKSVLHSTNPELAIPTSKDATTGGTDLKFPSDEAPYYMKLDFFKYGRVSTFQDTTLDRVGSITLPLPAGDGIIDHTTAMWNQMEFGMVGSVLDQIQNAEKTKQQVTSAAKGDITSWDGIRAATAQGGDAAAYALMANKGVQTLVGSEVMGGIQSVLGITPNPSLSQVFNGVSFRTFSFSWLLAPKTDQESITIKKITNMIKAMQLPTFSGSNGPGTSLFFNYPHVCKPSFGLGKEYLPIYKYCVINDVNVQYSPQGTIASFYSSTKAPAFVALNMTITEMEYVLATDYDHSAKGTSAVGSIGNLFTTIGDYMNGSGRQ